MNSKLVFSWGTVTVVGPSDSVLSSFLFLLLPLFLFPSLLSYKDKGFGLTVTVHEKGPTIRKCVVPKTFSVTAVCIDTVSKLSWLTSCTLLLLTRPTSFLGQYFKVSLLKLYDTVNSFPKQYLFCGASLHPSVSTPSHPSSTSEGPQPLSPTHTHQCWSGVRCMVTTGFGNLPITSDRGCRIFPPR